MWLLREKLWDALFAHLSPSFINFHPIIEISKKHLWWFHFVVQSSWINWIDELFHFSIKICTYLDVVDWSKTMTLEKFQIQKHWILGGQIADHFTSFHALLTFVQNTLVNKQINISHICKLIYKLIFITYWQFALKSFLIIFV